jgi:hypothetical protein
MVEKKLDKYLDEAVPSKEMVYYSREERKRARILAWKQAGYKDFVECCGTCKFRMSGQAMRRVYDTCGLPRNEKIVAMSGGAMEYFDIHEMGICPGYKKDNVIRSRE